ncbi:MAG: hypothetical protein JXB03_03940 [Spirochaetales bacterium]|nr:hypothetical protein [Spirochaetales bacterium]
MEPNASSKEYIELKFSPHWNYISAARSFLQNFLAISTGDQTRADRIAMSASELLENAVKYSVNSETYMYVGVDHESRSVSITVTNESTPESIQALKAIFDKVTKGDPLEAYVSQMKEAATRSDGKSQLGLVRIRYEAGAELSMRIEQDTRVSITVEMK